MVSRLAELWSADGTIRRSGDLQKVLLVPVANHSVTVDFDEGAQPTHEGHPPVASYVVVNRLVVAEHQRAERADTIAVHATFLVTADCILFVQLCHTHHDAPVRVALKFRVGLDRVSVILHKHTSDISGEHGWKERSALLCYWHGGVLTKILQLDKGVGPLFWDA